MEKEYRATIYFDIATEDYEREVTKDEKFLGKLSDEMYKASGIEFYDVFLDDKANKENEGSGFTCFIGEVNTELEFDTYNGEVECKEVPLYDSQYGFYPVFNKGLEKAGEALGVECIYVDRDEDFSNEFLYDKISEYNRSVMYSDYAESRRADCYDR